jgi:hypothetical protein
VGRQCPRHLRRQRADPHGPVADADVHFLDECGFGE